ncbi:MAG: ABC transporter transmembrane domain-containing protein, partial [Gammaproteobacteria bacterium]|nr:ABC transporter transmembrane domain-containing protein [Gammaproteobacteria bacterium]
MLGLSIGGLLIQRFGGNLLPLFMKTAIDSLSDPEIPPNFLLPALAILGVAALSFLVYVWARRALRRISIAVTYDLRKRLFKNVQIQGPGFFNKFGTGDLMSRAVNDVSQVRMSVSFGWVTVVMFFFSITM